MNNNSLLFNKQPAGARIIVYDNILLMRRPQIFAHFLLKRIWFSTLPYSSDYFFPNVTLNFVC